MITAVFSKKNLSFTISGHSGYDNKGFDIVCSAVTSVTEYFINTIEDFLKYEISVAVDEKKPQITVNLIEDNILAAMFESLIVHMQNIQQDYPNYLKVRLKYD